MRELIKFLLARIAEDKAVASNVAVLRYDPVRHLPAHQAITARVLADCESKRRIVEQVSKVEWGGYAVRDFILEQLALPYAAHPDYRQEWRPSV